MIAEIDHQCDIGVYLTPEELEKLPNEVLQGTLIKIDKPKQQGEIYLSVNDLRKNENGFGIGVVDTRYGWDSVGRVELFMGKDWYQRLKDRGSVGLRHRMMDGSKIDIYDSSRLDSFGTLDLKNLEFYRNNQESLPDIS